MLVPILFSSPISLQHVHLSSTKTVSSCLRTTLDAFLIVWTLTLIFSLKILLPFTSHRRRDVIDMDFNLPVQSS